MAKKKSRKKTTKQTEDMIPLTRVVRHINKQTFGANAATAISEAIDAPGFGGDFSTRKGYRSSPMLVQAWACQDPAQDSACTGVNAAFRAQIIDGDRTGDITGADMLDYDDNDLIMDLRLDLGFVTSGMGQTLGPWPLTPVTPLPILVKEKFTVAFQAGNHASWNSNDIFLIMWYQVMEIPSDYYTELLLNQQRKS